MQDFEAKVEELAQEQQQQQQEEKQGAQSPQQSDAGQQQQDQESQGGAEGGEPNWEVPWPFCWHVSRAAQSKDWDDCAPGAPPAAAILEQMAPTRGLAQLHISTVRRGELAKERAVTCCAGHDGRGAGGDDEAGGAVPVGRGEGAAGVYGGKGGRRPRRRRAAVRVPIVHVSIFCVTFA